MSKKITKDSVLGEVMELKGADKVLQKHKVPCLGCPMAQREMGTLKIEVICKTYGIDEKKLLEDLNKL